MRYASSGLPLTERLRRRIWGTENPPGLKDPFGGPGYFERRRQEAQEAQKAQEERGEYEAPEPSLPEPATPELDMAPIGRRQNLIGGKIVSKSVPRIDPEKEDPKYTAAENWDGLEHVGLSGHWSERSPGPEDLFRP